jgi:hypothetical protein
MQKKTDTSRQMKLKIGPITLSFVITIISLGVYVYLFGYADRKIVFLYEHLGLTPFDSMTIGRYWMAGFVLSGFLTILYLIYKLTARYLIKSKDISWIEIVKYSCIPLIIGVIIIITNLGAPRLTFIIAVSSALALIIGIMIGFSVADDLIAEVKSTLIYLIFGLGLVPLLLLFRVLELPGKGIVALNVAILVSVLTIVFGFSWLLISHRIFRQNTTGSVNIIKGTLLIGYLGLPVLHYIAATPKGIPYITSADNFFAESMILRLTNWIILILMVLLTDKLNKKINSRRLTSNQKDFAFDDKEQG